ncbi:MAG TPA: hypothetical protein VFL29_11425 [Candidatus Dormibacteraeota bacterium]|nr:hypothetical protein [Candidatus Dormibacteraeota bacterium]
MALAKPSLDQLTPEEQRRRILMAESDRLLDQVETLRLLDERDAPLSLREAIQLLQVRLGRKDPPLPPATLHAAHDLVFAVQQRLMAANPRHPRPHRHRGRAEGQPIVTRVHDERLWKVLALPPPPSGEPDAAWLELVDATVERAWDRWCYAHQHAVQAVRSRTSPHAAIAVARIAWDNYWELSEEALRIRNRPGAAPWSKPSGGREARPP